MKRIGIAFALSLMALFGLVGHVEAAQTAPIPQQSAARPQIAISPAVQDRALGPQETAAVFTVRVSNISDQPITFVLSSNDFDPANQTGGLAFQGSDINRVTKGHGLSSIASLDNTLLTVPANSSKDVKATINDLQRLAPGGHYTAILAQVLPNGSGANDKQVSINQIVSSLIFLETAGQGSKTIRLAAPPLNRLAFSLPSSVNLVFTATGNTQTTPRGIVTIEHGQTESGRGLINENSSLILPGSSRLLPIRLSGSKHPWLPGRYTLRVQYRYEGSLGVSTYQKTFFYVNPYVGIICIVFVVIVLALLWHYRRKLLRAGKYIVKRRRIASK